MGSLSACRLVRHLLRRGPRYGVVLVQPSGLDMAAISELVEEGRLRPVIDRTYPLDNVRHVLAQGLTNKIYFLIRGW